MTKSFILFLITITSQWRIKRTKPYVHQIYTIQLIAKHRKGIQDYLDDSRGNVPIIFQLILAGANYLPTCFPVNEALVHYAIRTVK